MLVYVALSIHGSSNAFISATAKVRRYAKSRELHQGDKIKIKNAAGFTEAKCDKCGDTGIKSQSIKQFCDCDKGRSLTSMLLPMPPD